MKTKKEISIILNISVPTIDRLMKKGLPFIKIGKSVRFEDEKVLEWIKEKQN
jgi:excisionase family DNA binding protein